MAQRGGDADVRRSAGGKPGHHAPGGPDRGSSRRIRLGAAPLILLALLSLLFAGTAEALATQLPDAHVGGYYSETYSLDCPDISCPILVGITGQVPPGLSADTFHVSGTPLKAGSYSFTVTVKGINNGKTASGTFSINAIGADDDVVLDITPGTVPDGEVGVLYQADNDWQFRGTGSPSTTAFYTIDIIGGALPPGLTLFNGFVKGTPTTAGTYHFTLGVADNAGHSGERAYTMVITGGQQQPVVVSPATLPGGQAGTAYSQTLTASGGDGGPYGFSVSAGSLPGGLSLAGSGALTGTPTAAGSFSFTVTATDHGGATGQQAYTVRILAAGARPDPAEDPDVQALLDAQAQSAQQFAEGQMDNVNARMDRLHGQTCRPPLENGIRVSGPGAGGDPETVAMPGIDGRCDDSRRSGLSVWAGGMVDLGSRDPAGAAKRDFVSINLTTGVDYRFSDRFVAGVALGYGSDSSDIGADGTHSDGEAASATLYASFQATPKLFVDALAGYGSFSFDSRRYDSNADAFAAGRRSGDQVYGSITAGYRTEFGAFTLTPFARLSASSSKLDPFTETGAGMYALSFGRQSVDSLGGTVGIRGGTDIPMDTAILSPRFRLDYTHEFDGGSDVAIRYADLPGGPAYAVDTVPFARDRITVGLGADLRLAGGTTIGLDYAGSFGLDEGGTSHAFGLRVAGRF